MVAQSQCLPVRTAVPAGSCAVLAPAAAFSWGAAYDTWSRYSRSAGRTWTVSAVSSPRTPRMSWRRLPWRQQTCAWGLESLGGTVSVSASTATSSWLAQRCWRMRSSLSTNRHSSLEEDPVTHFVVLPNLQEDEGMHRETLENLCRSPFGREIRVNCVGHRGL